MQFANAIRGPRVFQSQHRHAERLRLAACFDLAEGHQLWQLNAIAVPDGVDEAAVRKRLLADHSIEVGAGLGPLKGIIWRIGLMGETSSLDNVKKFLSAFGGILNDAGFKVDTKAAMAATEAHKA